MYYIIDVTAVGSVALLLYTVIDFIRKGKVNLLNRFLFYSFILYLLFVTQLTTGGINIPPHRMMEPRMQLIPFYFIGDLYTMYQGHGLDWFFKNSLKLTSYNLLLLVPMGVYLSLLLKIRNSKHALLIIFLSSLVIETGQLAFSYLGIIEGRVFNVDDLILNTTGGFIGYFLTNSLKRRKSKGEWRNA
ncbi:VanZ family protein [Bacillus sp. SG-1]|uniref:VanZ family protein n=1 Tax=Bacillus sp. SG-1 TaxID=161544 RepID=UPI0001543383|nr:VanZ family protein [Bacillus sp. SG-1]EDL66671.1 hypothetical protein BSG1_04925 [Bacillus sp. SG-1]